MARYAKILKCDIANGTGFRVTVFLTGCPIHCPGCFNKSIWSPSAGTLLNSATLNKIRAELKKSCHRGISILGGEPLAPWNLEATRLLCREAWKLGKDAWVWTGYTFENLDAAQRRALDFCDYLIDGPFIEEIKDTSLKWRGSRNQRILKHIDGDTWDEESDKESDNRRLEKTQ